MMRIPLLLAVAALAACAHRHPADTAAEPAAEAAAQPERGPDSWIAHYVAEKEREKSQLFAAGLASDWEFIHEQVLKYLPPQSYPATSHAAQAQLREAHAHSTTSFLVRIGYRARHLAHPAQALTLVRAASITSWDDADALVLVSPTVFVADLIRVDRKPDNSADLVYRVREPIKGAPAAGSEVRHPLNGPFPTVVARPGDPPPPPPPPNPAAWELAGRKSVLFFRSAPDAIGNFFGPMPIEGERVLPGYHSTTRETTLDAIRAAAKAQLCSPGYVPVVAGANLEHQC